jgi:uncharacterized DUF497 family protein
MHLHIQSAVITWDEAKRLRNRREHGVDFADLEPLFEGQVLTQEDERAVYGEQRFQSLGVVNGECLFVAWTLRNGGEVPHIISARRATKHETQAWYETFSKWS